MHSHMVVSTLTVVLLTGGVAAGADVPEEQQGIALVPLEVSSEVNVKRQDLESALGTVEPGEPLQVEIGGPHGRSRATEHPVFASTFGDVPVGQPLLYEDSYGRLCLADNQGDLAARLELTEDQAITIRRPA